MNQKIILIFVGLAVAIFGGAVIWNNYIAYEPVPIKTEEQKAKEAMKPRSRNVVKTTNTDKPQTPVPAPTATMVTAEDLENIQEQSNNKMINSLKYSDPKSILADIRYYKSEGLDDRADELIDLIKNRFPDFELPKSLESQ